MSKQNQHTLLSMKWQNKIINIDVHGAVEQHRIERMHINKAIAHLRQKSQENPGWDDDSMLNEHNKRMSENNLNHKLGS